MTPSEREQKQVDALLASYSAIKDEIGRRSALTWTAVGGYLAFILAAFKEVLDNNDWRMGVWAVSTWPIAYLAYQFYCRENCEIRRLSNIIINQIEERLRRLLPAHGCPLLLERADPRNVWATTKRPNAVSQWAIFLGGPAAVTVLAVAIVSFRCLPDVLNCVGYALLAISATFIVAFAALLIQQLYQHAPW